MNWQCIHCEVINSPNDNFCVICKTERYYAASEIVEKLTKNPDYQDLKLRYNRLNTQVKRLKTRNRNIHEELKIKNKILNEWNQKAEKVGITIDSEESWQYLFQTAERTKKRNKILTIMLLVSIGALLFMALI